MSNCIFCKIIAGEIPSSKVYEDDKVLAIRDINPQAPVHILFMPKRHMSSILSLDETYAEDVSAIMSAIVKVANDLGISEENGMRIINNCGPDGAQSVMHLHFHLLAGTKLGENIV